MGINVYYNYYVPGNPVRAAEVLSCFAALLGDKAIDRVIVLSERCDFPANARVVWHKCPSRPTFADYFAAVEEHSAPDDVNAIVNSDCFFRPGTARALARIRPDEAYCISRHDVTGMIPLRLADMRAARVRHTGQDCWVVRGKPKPGMWLDYGPGTLHCDNRLAHELKACGYRILDPFLTVQVLHFHPCDERVWTQVAAVPPPYAYPAYHGWRERLFGVFAPRWDALRYRCDQIVGFVRSAFSGRQGFRSVKNQLLEAVQRRWNRLTRRGRGSAPSTDPTQIVRAK